MTRPLGRVKLEGMLTSLLNMLAEADAAGAYLLAVHLTLAVEEVETKLASDNTD